MRFVTFMFSGVDNIVVFIEIDLFLLEGSYESFGVAVVPGMASMG